jgi:three-Cys-motif partner protein
MTSSNMALLTLFTMAMRSGRRSKEDQFFDEKKEWSRTKDRVVGAYLVPYLHKVKRLGSKIILIDPFAGPGKFLADGAPGSPLIITTIAEKIVPGQYLAVFGNKRLRSHQKLTTLLKPLIEKGAVETHHLQADELLMQMGSRLARHTVFLYIDPYGLPPSFYTLQSFLERKQSTEILLNLPPIAIQRVAAMGEVTAQFEALHNHLTASLGNQYWRAVYENGEFDASERVERVIREYRERIKKHLPYSGWCPIRQREGAAIKYYMTFFSGHPDSPRLYNELMRTAYREGLYLAMTKGTLFEGVEPTIDNQPREVDELKDMVIELLAKTGRVSRERLWSAIVDQHFMRFGVSNYIKAVRQLSDESRIGFEDIRRTGQLNDDAVLYLKKRGSSESPAAGPPVSPGPIVAKPKAKELPAHLTVKIKVLPPVTATPPEG